MAKIRARGHRVGTAGVGLLKQALNATQRFAAHLNDEHLLATAEALLGDFACISYTDAAVNLGTKRGYYHADPPCNATNIGAPYASERWAIMHLSSIWMLIDFSAHNGRTFVAPDSHRSSDNPAGETLRGSIKTGRTRGSGRSRAQSGASYLNTTIECNKWQHRT